MKEYFPSDYQKMKQYIDAGRWYPAGSSMEEGDVNATECRGDHSADPVWQHLFPKGIR